MTNLYLPSTKKRSRPVRVDEVIGLRKGKRAAEEVLASELPKTTITTL